jgi:hypothetical protein
MGRANRPMVARRDVDPARARVRLRVPLVEESPVDIIDGHGAMLTDAVHEH